jgi:Protein of unknown function (DUF4232)
VILQALVLFASFVLAMPHTAAEASPCAFVLGFATLHDLIPSVVGECVDDETHNPDNGDALQLTTNGLLVWRKVDNWTAFTDGSQSWVNGPLGLQQRSNDQRFAWESNPDQLAIMPTPKPGDRCHTAGLTLSLVDVDAGAGNLVGTFRFTNMLNVGCTFFGYPGALLLDAQGNALPTTVVRGGGYFSSQPPPSTVAVPAGWTALFRIHWEQVPVNDEPTCSMAETLAITPPDEYVPLTLAVQIRACGGGHLDVSTVQADVSSP